MPCLLSKVSQQQQRLASVVAFQNIPPSRAAPVGCQEQRLSAHPHPPTPASYPVCPSCFLSASIPPLPEEAHQVLGLGTMHLHSPLASQGFQNYLEREQDEGHSSGFWDGAAPGLGGEGYKERWLVG